MRLSKNFLSALNPKTLQLISTVDKMPRTWCADCWGERGQPVEWYEVSDYPISQILLCESCARNRGLVW